MYPHQKYHESNRIIPQLATVLTCLPACVCTPSVNQKNDGTWLKEKAVSVPVKGRSAKRYLDTKGNIRSRTHKGQAYSFSFAFAHMNILNISSDMFVDGPETVDYSHAY